MIETLEVPYTTIHVALAIGLFDLFLSETFRSSVTNAKRTRERAQLFQNRVLEIPNGNLHRGHSRYPTCCRKFFITKRTKKILIFAQVILLVLCLWLELSISEKGFPSTKLIAEKCYQFERKTKILARRVPTTDSLRDPRIPQYIADTKCLANDTLLSEAVAGQTALIRGYPQCTRTKFRKFNGELRDNLTLQGGGIAHVGTWFDGEPYAAYAAASLSKRDFGWGNITGFATTSIWSWLFSSYNGSSFKYVDTSVWYWARLANTSDRIVVNVELPQDFYRDAPESYNSSQSGFVNCTSRTDWQCFKNYSVEAHSLDKQRQIYDNVLAVQGGVAIRATEHNETENTDMKSQACVFGRVNVRIQLDWVYMILFMNDTKRKREGPVATDIYLGVTGDDIWCIDLPYKTSKMYIDATARVNLSDVPTAFQKGNNASESDGNGAVTIESIKEVLMAAAVVNGLTPVQDTEYDCHVFEHVTGSSIGMREIIVSSVYISLLAIVSIVALFSWCRNRRLIPSTSNPLSIKSLLKQLRRLQRNEKNGNGTCEEEEEGEDNFRNSSDHYSVRLHPTDSNGYAVWVS